MLKARGGADSKSFCGVEGPAFSLFGLVGAEIIERNNSSKLYSFSSGLLSTQRQADLGPHSSRTQLSHDLAWLGFEVFSILMLFHFWRIPVHYPATPVVFPPWYISYTCTHFPLTYFKLFIHFRGHCSSRS